MTSTQETEATNKNASANQTVNEQTNTLTFTNGEASESVILEGGSKLNFYQIEGFKWD